MVKSLRSVSAFDDDERKGLERLDDRSRARNLGTVSGQHTPQAPSVPRRAGDLIEITTERSRANASELMTPAGITRPNRIGLSSQLGARSGIQTDETSMVAAASPCFAF